MSREKRKKIINTYMRIFFLILILFISGCGSPFANRQRQAIDNQNGKIDDIANNTNGIMLDLLKLKNEQQILQRDVDNFQQGLVNLSNKNEGIQIFQGEGGLIVGFSLMTIAMLLIYNYRNKALLNQKSAEIMAQEIIAHDSEELKDNVFKAAMYTDVEENIYRLIKKK